jgi:hypothetical protein
MISPVNSGTLYQSSLSGQIWLPVDENVGTSSRAAAAASSGSLSSTQVAARLGVAAVRQRVRIACAASR